MIGFVKSATLAAATAGLFATAAPALAAESFHQPASTSIVNGSDNSWQHSRDRDYDRHGRRGYGEPVYASTRTWRGRDGRYYCRKKDGTTGLLIGGAVGGVVGHELGGRGDRTVGTILGVAGGALLGRAIDRSGSRRCR